MRPANARADGKLGTYDHLDHPSVLALNARGVPFIVPLGVGGPLECWGVSPERIHELD